MKKVKWGILGSGKIANIFSTALQTVENAEIYGVASRTLDEKNTLGREFVNKFGCSKSYESFDLLLEDDNVDIVYIALPHSVHKEYVMKALYNNKNVLCEKPLGINAVDVKLMIDLARERKLFLMEGLWTNFLPVIKKVRRYIDEGIIGEIKLVRADFGFPAPLGNGNRFRNPQLAGGALLDIGIYTIAFAQMVFGKKPHSIISSPYMSETGVDLSASIIFDYSGGVRAELSISFESFLANQALVSGDKGAIIIDKFFGAEKATVITQYGQNIEEIVETHRCNGYEYQAEKVTNCIYDSKLECDEMTLDETLALIETMDQIRSQWRLKYPMED